MSIAIYNVELAKLLREVILNAEPAFKVVLGYDTDAFDGYPAACFELGDSPSEFETSAENLRTFTYAIKLFVDTNVSKSPRLDLSNLVDATLEALDQNDDLNSTATQMHPGQVISYQDEVTSAGTYAVAEISVEIERLVGTE